MFAARPRRGGPTGRRLAGVATFEQVQKFTLLDRGFTVESGELTPTLKLRRDVILANCADAIEKMYAA